MMSRIDTRHWKISNGCHFQNFRHNTAQIQHCPISYVGRLWCPELIPIFVVLWWPFWKWRPVEIFRCRESTRDVEIEQCWICVVLWWPRNWHTSQTSVLFYSNCIIFYNFFDNFVLLFWDFVTKTPLPNLINIMLKHLMFNFTVNYVKTKSRNYIWLYR
jgi:hypothetical protein